MKQYLHEQIYDRIERFGMPVEPGTIHLVADVLRITSLESERWTNRADDARRIPNMIYENARKLELMATKFETQDSEVKQ